MKNPKIIFDINSFNLDNILNTVKKMKKDTKGLVVSKQKKFKKTLPRNYLKKKLLNQAM